MATAQPGPAGAVDSRIGQHGWWPGGAALCPLSGEAAVPSLATQGSCPDMLMPEGQLPSVPRVGPLPGAWVGNRSQG